MSAPPANVPLRLIRHQGRMLKTIARIVLHTALPRRHAVPRDLVVERTIAPPSPKLIDRYAAWCGAAERYRMELPPHMVSHWSLPLVSELLLRMPYRLTSVINQGVTMRVHGPLPRGVPLQLRASLQSAEENDGRVRVTVAFVTGTAQRPLLVETLLHMSFIVRRRRGPKTERAAQVQPQWQTAGHWRASARDGLNFALLTGDFNPIHWCGPLARRSVFGGKVLHGFGSFVRSYEQLERGSFSEIDVRFLRPVPLPSAVLQVEQAGAGDDGWRPLRLSDGGIIHLAGRCR